MTRALWITAAIVFAILCLAKARIIGDGLEYLAMTQGFAAHGSPDLRRSDVKDFRAMPPAALERGRLRPEVLDGALDRTLRGGTIDAGFVRARDGSVQAIHFWMYSLLAVPFYWLVTALGQNPWMALVALNLAFLGFTAWRLRAGMPELALLVLMGPLYYTVWIGPEVMAGCCVLLACLGLLRRDLAAAVAFAGLGATQNPSIAGLILAAPCYALLYRLFPASVFDAAPRRPRWARVALLAAGIGAAFLPYLHNQSKFGMPSIIARYYNDMALATPERLFSFLFDLNQGMLIGFPALLSCAAIVVWHIEPGRRRSWCLHAILACLLAIGLALPTLTATNWNSGSLIVSRYGYWTSMPLLAVCLAGLVRLDTRTRWLALTAAVLLQAASSWQAWHTRPPPFLVHGRIAAWVLDHAPRWYNPDPEIFLERTLHREQIPTPEQVLLHTGSQGTTKVMRFWSNHGDTGGLCAPGSWLAADHVTTLVSGWRYYNAPLRCVSGPAPGLRYGVGQSGLSLGDGWWNVEGAAVWTEGARSTLRLTLPPGRKVARIALEGNYYDGVKRTRLAINGEALGDVMLGPRPITAPAASGEVLDITLEHTLPQAPPGERRLGFFLHAVYVEFAAGN